MIEKDFVYGIIDGYYGTLWSEKVLCDYALFCREYGHSFFIYAPKAEAYLREKWFEPFSQEQCESLARVRQSFKEQGIAFGIGFSPYGLNVLDEEAKQKLSVKMRQLNALNLDILGIFFDDLNKEDISEDLGSNQVDIAHYIASISSAQRYITVPTYYSYDAILQRVLGEIPPQYFEQFSHIDAQFDIFWTGRHIVSDGYTRTELQQVAEIFGRKPFIWDNYPVNDMAYKKDFLLVMGLTGRSYDLVYDTAGIAFNPMIQPYMSAIPMSTAQQLFSGEDYNPRQAYLTNMKKLCGKELANAIDDNLNYFILNGLRNTELSNLKRMKELFASFKDSNEKRFTAEIIDLIDVYMAQKSK